MVSEDPSEMSGINNRKELVRATAWLRDRVNSYWLDQGVEIVDTKSTYISTDVTIGRDTLIYPNVRIEGNTVIGESNTITEGTYICDSRIGKGNTIISSRLVNCEIGDDVTIGPWVSMTDGE